MGFSFKVKVDPKFEKLLKEADKNNLINKTKKIYAKIAPPAIQHAVLDDISKGISPVQGEGKYAKYSESYKDEIKAKKSKRMIKNASKGI